MILHWNRTDRNPDGNFRSVKIGSKLCGVFLSQERPISIEVTKQELLFLLDNQEYMKRVLLPCLR